MDVMAGSAVTKFASSGFLTMAGPGQGPLSAPAGARAEASGVGRWRGRPTRSSAPSLDAASSGCSGLRAFPFAGAVTAVMARRRGRLRKPPRSRAAAAKVQMQSPFAEGAQVGKPKLPLTMENVELVLDELRPYLQNDGGDCRVVEIDGPVLRLEMQGSCSSCSSSAITLKMGIERTLLDRIPEIFEVVAEMPGTVTPTEEGIEKVLSTIRPFLSVSGGTIELVELDLGEGLNALPSITLGMTGPAQRNKSVRMEVVRRVRFIYGQALVEVIGDDD